MRDGSLESAIASHSAQRVESERSNTAAARRQTFSPTRSCNGVVFEYFRIITPLIPLSLRSMRDQVLINDKSVSGEFEGPCRLKLLSRGTLLVYIDCTAAVRASLRTEQMKNFREFTNIQITCQDRRRHAACTSFCARQGRLGRISSQARIAD